MKKEVILIVKQQTKQRKANTPRQTVFPLVAPVDHRMLI